MDPVDPVHPEAPEAARLFYPLRPRGLPGASSLVSRQLRHRRLRGKYNPHGFKGPFWKVVTAGRAGGRLDSTLTVHRRTGRKHHDAMLSSNRAVRGVQTIGKQNFDVGSDRFTLFAHGCDTSRSSWCYPMTETILLCGQRTRTRVGLSAYSDRWGCDLGFAGQ